MSGDRSAVSDMPVPASVAAHRLPAQRWHAFELLFWLLPVAAFFLFPGYRVLGSQILIVALFALSLDLILGYAGIVSLGHAAFFGVGAYTAGLLAAHGWGEPLSGLLLAGALSALVGYASGFLVMRGEDLARLMVTMGIGLVLFEAANRAAFLTGGVDGLHGVEMWPLLGLFRFDVGGRTAYVYALVVLFVLFVVLRTLVRSPFGLALRGIRERRARMPAIGASVRQIEIRVFTLGAAVAGVAGALLAQTTQFVGLNVLGFDRSAELLIILVLGGTGRLYGALIGAAVFLVAQDVLAGINPVYWQFWIGALLIVIVLFARGGVLGALAAGYERWGARRAGARDAAPPPGSPTGPAPGARP
jgi:branched-chain amino acid transport system permease protein